MTPTERKVAELEARVRQLESELDAVTRRLGLAMIESERLRRLMMQKAREKSEEFMYQFQQQFVEAVRNGAEPCR